MNVFAFAARALRREFRHGELRTLAAALVLAVAALTAVTTLGQRVERAILASAAELIGGDLGVAARRAVAPAFAERATALGLATNRSAEFPSVVFAAGKSQLAQVFATDAHYPLRGSLLIRGADGAERAAGAPPAGSVYADRLVLSALGIGVGDALELAGKPLTVAGEIVRQPDGGQMFSLAPRLIAAIADAEDGGLLGVGSRARHKLMVAGTPAALEQFQAFAKPQLADGAQLVTVGEAQQNLRTAFERGEAFLRLAALLSALLSGIAVALAAQRYARRKTDEVALLRALGLGKREVLATLSLTLLLLGLPACLLGAGVGLALQDVVLRYAGDLLPGAMPPPLSLLPALAAIAVGLAVLVGFALPPLARLRDVPPVRVFQRAVAMRPRRFDVLYLLPPLVAFGLIATQSGSARIASALGGSLAGVAAITLVCGFVLIFLMRRLGQRLPGALRFGLANLARRRALSLIQATALALSFTSLLVLAVVGPGLLAAWRADLPPETPNHFLLNLQTDQRDAVTQRLADAGARSLNLLPIAVGKLIAINGQAPRAEDYEDRRAAGWINGEMRLSWSDTLPESNKLREGQWFDGSATTPQASVDRVWVDMFHLKIGDTMTMRVGEREIVATIANVREVDWTSFRVNFFVLLDPATARSLPHSHIASFWLPAERAAAMQALSRDYTNLSLIDIDAILDRVRDIIDQVTRAVTAVLGFSLVAGLLVLIAALNVSAEERRFETALLRTLGAGRGQLAATVLGEFALLGLIAGLIAAGGAIVAGISLGRGVFRIAWTPDLPPFALGVAAAIALVTLAGWLGTRAIARTSPLLVLRKE